MFVTFARCPAWRSMIGPGNREVHRSAVMSPFSVILSVCFGMSTGASDLESCLGPLVKGHKGKVAIAVKHLVTGESYYLNADEPMPTASLIKLPVMIEVYQQVAEGRIKLFDPVTLRQEDKVPGSGVLTEHFTPGVTFPLRDAVHL